MGSKGNKRRFFIVNYIEKPDGKFDEYVELSKKHLGNGKIAQARVILDLIDKEVVKVDLPNVPEDFPFDALYKHYRKWYADVIDEFLQ